MTSEATHGIDKPSMLGDLRRAARTGSYKRDGRYLHLITAKRVFGSGPAEWQAWPPLTLP